ncbi:MAG: bifunctional DNA-formamidopyrimidine glycosylase/DNA-(apurinic or apyrimidinic site) lyase [Halothiobacillaceae bacterium]|nr:MAG: bifunctional DNA-formamidopyrimidine glycosylase/DNA-(apurinic or apyrimidinic site) lyase [Halothiobacillaceae bacterium]
MPELPEVETTRRGIEPHLTGHRLGKITIRERRLRWPIQEGLEGLLHGHVVQQVRRRAKYLLIELGHGTLITHLGMSGSLRLVEPGTALRKHDHVDIRLDSGLSLRLHDPRRFGALLWTDEPIENHPLLARLGPEPLEGGFDGAYLYGALHTRKQAIKSAIMDSHIVVGVGNIYANESLFLAGIDPRRACNRIARHRVIDLASRIKQVLAAAVEQGGTTLRDFVNPEGQPGYFQQTLNVYGRPGLPCPSCATPMSHTLIGQRATFYCPTCQR